MSTLVYAAVEKQRKNADPGTSTTTEAPKTRTWLDVVVALVPAEVLAIHAFAVSEFTSTEEVGPEGNKEIQTVIHNQEALQWTFWLLILLAIVLYVSKKKGALDGLDILRAAIPPAAFVLWTMLQQNTAFDAVFPDFDEGVRTVVAVVGAALLGAVAQRLGVASDRATPDDGGGQEGPVEPVAPGQPVRTPG